MPVVIIDGREIEVKKGMTILEAAKSAGIEIPHFCYHPGLKPAGTCRMCLVEISGNPKLQTACTTEIQDGMVVNTSSPAVKKAREEILTLLLYDHPLDCPICDKAGECLLQKNYNEHGSPQVPAKESMIKREKKIFISNKLVLDRERCVLCTRCVRFLEEITGTRELLVSKRGDNSEIDIFIHSFVSNIYSGNLVDICPVGAIGDLDFRFKSRVWFLKEVPSICPLCARGCNIFVDIKGEIFPSSSKERVLRIRPRFSEINKYWICDLGRYKLPELDRNRITNPILIEPNGIREVSLEEALMSFSHCLEDPKKVAIISSYYLTNEENQMIKEVFFDRMGIRNIAYLGEEKGIEDKILLTSERDPNREGVKKIWGEDIEKESRKVIDAIKDKNFKLIILIGDEIFENKELFSSIEIFSVWILSRSNQFYQNVRVVIPMRNFFEKEGSFTNINGIVQKFPSALPPFKNVYDLKYIISQIASITGIKMDKKLFENSNSWSG